MNAEFTLVVFASNSISFFVRIQSLKRPTFVKDVSVYSTTSSIKDGKFIAKSEHFDSGIFGFVTAKDIN